MKFCFKSILPHYSLLCHVRHHGFPSPLLDWSLSYYVAAFFAFREVKLDKHGDLVPSIVAIYSYQDKVGKDFYGPAIYQKEHYVETHPRHYKQQSIYTICGKIEMASSNIEKAKLSFVSHETSNQNSIKKFVLKASEKKDVLEKLYFMNINDYTLFGSEESLLQMLAFKEFNEFAY